MHVTAFFKTTVRCDYCLQVEEELGCYFTGYTSQRIYYSDFTVEFQTDGQEKVTS